MINRREVKASKPVQPPAPEWLGMVGSSYEVF